MIPHLYVERVEHVRPQTLIQYGIEGVLIDLDGTLRDFEATEFSSDVRRWVRAVQETQIKICLFSNGKEARIKKAAEQLQVPYIYRAMKPLPLRVDAGLAAMNVPRGRAALIGDQIFADILAGRLAGLISILVNPTTHSEPWITRIKRPLEKPIRFWLRHSKRYQAAQLSFSGDLAPETRSEQD